MSASDSQYSEIGPAGIVVLLAVIFLIWACSGGRHYFHNTGQDIRATLYDAGQDLKSSGP